MSQNSVGEKCMYQGSKVKTYTKCIIKKIGKTQHLLMNVNEVG